MKIIRVFPRKTNATPDDENVRFGPPLSTDAADAVRVSVTWTADRQKAEILFSQWRHVCADVQIGGPAFDDPGGEFEPGLYVKKGYTITSRGCPNRCWFCYVPKREGGIRELEIKPGNNILDSNLLACSSDHIKKVFAMLSKQKERPKFTGGLEAKRFKKWHANALVKLKPSSAYFAYDTPDDWEPLVEAVRLLDGAGMRWSARTISCYVLIGYKNDTFEKAEKRLTNVLKLGIMPMAMLFNRAEGRDDADKWKRLQREYANKIIVGTKLSAFKRERSVI